MKDDHASAAEISALAEDLLAPREAERIRAHVAGCTDCAAARDDLDLLRRELSELDHPGPMPSDVAARIEAALAAEPALVSRETPAGASPLRRRLPRLALAAAGALVALAVGSSLLGILEPPGQHDSAAGEAAEQSAEEATQDLMADTFTTPEGEDGAGAANELAPHEEADLESRVQSLLARAEEGDVSPESGSESPRQESAGGPPSSASATPLPPCVRSALDRTEEPLAAQPHRFRAADAYVVVLPRAGEPEQVDVYVVDATCDSLDLGATSEVLVHRSYPWD
ncbi:hypothetical protein GCM10009716_32970 [Streptomyces sodiiphilus]|uniref:Putative zinc-finger domain-containing protein n=1 Tax=Streptomyces sodiiphilus TaxID=226217 RepID=A0ABN2PJ40_9ACTN